MAQTLTPEDLDLIERLFARQDPSRKSPMEAGSPEFAEDRTQVNSLNNKHLFDSHLDMSLAGARRSQVNFDQLSQIAVRALNNSVELQSQLNQRTLASADQTLVELARTNAQALRLEADNAYVTRYDLSNPVATGTGDAVRAAAYTPNRATDTASAGVAAGVTESVQTNITAQVAALTTMVNNLADSVTTAVQALADSNALIASALSALAPAKA